MERIKRTERIVAIMRVFTSNPCRLITLGEFVDMFGCAKSTLSEDIAHIKSSLLKMGMGTLETVNGTNGGLRFLPFNSDESDRLIMESVCEELKKNERILPGGYLYTTDMFSNPKITQAMGEIFAKHFYARKPDVVVTVESMGVPIASMTAKALGIPMVTARHNIKASEGSTVTINYVSASSNRMQSMSLSRRLLHRGERALIIDDFMKGGGTAKGIADLLSEFDAEIVGTGVIIATEEPKKKLVDDFYQLMTLYNVDTDNKIVDIKSRI